MPVKAAWWSAACCALIVLACGGQDSGVPPELVGRWVTDARAYADRSLVIGTRSLVFASGPAASQNFAVRGVELNTLPDGTREAVIAYGAAGEGLTLRVRRYETIPPSIRLGDRPERWTRIPGSERLP